MKKEIANRIEAVKNLKNERKEFIKSIREENAREWQNIIKGNEAVYVYRSFEDADDYRANGQYLRKVTVVGCVKLENDGTYTMSIGWARMHQEDTYNRKVGNITAGRRANNPTEAFEFNGRKVMPMVLKGFATPVLKANFMPIAASIVQMYEDMYDDMDECYHLFSTDFDDYQQEMSWFKDAQAEEIDEDEFGA